MSEKGNAKDCPNYENGWFKMGCQPQHAEKNLPGICETSPGVGISCWGQTASSNFLKVKKVQHQNLRLMTGGMKSTPIREMETLSGLQSIEDRRDSKTLI